MSDPDHSLFSTLKRTGKKFVDDGMMDWAAALTYYGLLSLFPMLIALVSIIGLFADPESTTEKLTEIVSNLGPDAATSTFSGPVESLTSNRGASGVTFVIGLVLSIWAASGYVGAFGRASNAIFGTEETRPFWKLKPRQLAITVAMIVILALLAIGLVMTGTVVRSVAGPLGIGSTAVDVWNVAKWPVMVALVLLMFAVLYHFSPDADSGPLRWFTPGAIVALSVWVLASAGFAFYVGNFGSYDETYGTLGGIVVLLVWFWISNLAVLFGLELNNSLVKPKNMIQSGNELAGER
ncbi:MAG: YihY/virulence factor BrkB family protein [Solirubrobacterales bacterium]|nr:YihY/virulence factor BrkB family protein [Solirubrobacterales bacterium]